MSVITIPSTPTTGRRGARRCTAGGAGSIAASPATVLATSLAALLAASLAGCGGGGGGGGSELQVTVPTAVRAVAASAGSDATAANLGNLGGWLARAVLSTASEGVLDITGVRESPQSSGVANSALRAPVMGMPAHVLRAVARLGAPFAATREKPSATSVDTQPCENEGGSFTVTFDDADNSTVLSTGDLLTLAVTNCVLDSTTPIANGSVTLKLNGVEINGRNEVTAIDADVTFSNFALAGYGSYSGAARFWTKPQAGGERSRMSFLGTSVTLAGATIVYDFDVYALSTASTNTFEVDGGIGIAGQTYSVVASGSMSGTVLGPPSTGTLRLRDAAGDSIQLSARSALLFDLDFFPSGATAPTASLPGLRWADYLGTPQ